MSNLAWFDLNSKSGVLKLTLYVMKVVVNAKNK